MIDLHPTLILHNARVYTVDPARPWAQAVAVGAGRILAVGADQEVLPLAGPATEQIDCGGHLLLPGLWDAHIHFLRWSLGLRQVRLADAQSKAEMLARIHARAQQTRPGDWIVGQGWNESNWGETTFPTRADLDPVTGPDRPALFTRSDMHAAVANSAALQAAGIDASTPNPPGGVIDRDADAAPTGVLRETAIDLVSRLIPPPDEQEIDRALLEGMATLHRLGVTAITDQRMKGPSEGASSLAGFQRLRDAGRLHLRVTTNVPGEDLAHLVALGLRTGWGDDRLRLGHVKVFTDGSLGSRTAWMLEPFLDPSGAPTDNRGVNVTPVEEMARTFREATLAGFPISVHAIGDLANRVCLDIFEELASSGLRPPIPHRIEHVQTIHMDDLPRLAQLGITASVQPIHVTDDMDTGDLLLGPRTAHMYPFAALRDSGARLALGSDAPVSNPNPFLGIHAGLYRQRVERMDRPAWHPAQRLTLPDLIRGYTLGAAEAVGWDGELGSITPGKRADLALLDRDLFTLAESQEGRTAIAETQVILTLFDGEIVHRGGKA